MYMCHVYHAHHISFCVSPITHMISVVGIMAVVGHRYVQPILHLWWVRHRQICYVWWVTDMTCVMTQIWHVWYVSHTWVRTPNLKSFVCTYEWVTFYMNESRLTWMSHVSHEWVTSHMYESCLACMRFASIRHICAYMKQSCLTCVIFEVTYVHTWMSQVSHVSYLKSHMCTHEWVTSYMHDTHVHTCRNLPATVQECTVMLFLIIVYVLLALLQESVCTV